MRLRLVIVVVVFLLAGITVASLLLGPSMVTSIGRSGSGSSESGLVEATLVKGNAIVRENMQTGTTTWQIPPGRAATTQIQAYAGARSVLPGKSIVFYVSTQTEGMPYTIDIYRLGWYGGLGGRLMADIEGQVGHAQGYYDVTNQRLMGCTSCIVDAATGLVEANWQPSYTLQVPPDWMTGVYLAKFIDNLGMQTYVPFDVEGPAPSDYIVVTPDTTYAAYNTWGGEDLYAPDNNQFGLPGESDTVVKGRAVKVSFDRPYVQGNGSSEVLLFEANAIRWMEREGYDLSYASDIDLQENPGLLAQHKVYISIGHDEYWTRQMRDAVEGARDAGMSLAFFGADTSYWQIRLEPDNLGVADQTVVCYKVSTASNDLARDPDYATNPTLVTTAWRDPALARPEDAMVGIMYSNLVLKTSSFPWHLNPGVSSSLLTGTHLAGHQAYGCGIVGYEWDRVYNDATTPKNLHILGITATTTDTGAADQSDTTYYVAPSGAIVFASGTLDWAQALDTYRFQPGAACASQPLVVPDIQIFMMNVMKALVTHKVS
jgi:hypothetical protein